MTSEGGFLRRAFTRLTVSDAEIEAAELQTECRAKGATPVAALPDRARVQVCGTLRTVTLRPRAGVPALEAELYDGSGTVSLVWLGRRSIPGIEPGRSLSARGLVTLSGANPVMFNPAYDLRPDGRRVTPERGATAVLTATTVEELVRQQLSTALGGRRGLLEGAVPTLAFTITYVVSHELRLSLELGLGFAAVVLVLRILQRSTVQFAVNSFVGIAIAAFIASRTGRAEDVFLPGIIWNAAAGTIIVITNVVRWPLVGLLLAGATGDFTWWRRDPAVLGLCTKLTWIFVVPNVIRLLVQAPLYFTHHVGWLGATKLALGWPLYLAVVAVMGVVLTKGHTPLPASFRGPGQGTTPGPGDGD